MTSEATTAPSAPANTPNPFERSWDMPLAYAVIVLDRLARWLVAVLSLFTRAHDVGMFFHWNREGWFDAYKDKEYSPGSGSYILRLGRVEYIFCYKAPKAFSGHAPQP